mgnify:CR=1 FL=1
MGLAAVATTSAPAQVVAAMPDVAATTATVMLEAAATARVAHAAPSRQAALRGKLLGERPWRRHGLQAV